VKKEKAMIVIETDFPKWRFEAFVLPKDRHERPFRIEFALHELRAVDKEYADGAIGPSQCTLCLKDAGTPERSGALLAYYEPCDLHDRLSKYVPVTVCASCIGPDANLQALLRPVAEDIVRNFPQPSLDPLAEALSGRAYRPG
jgi:hypothetical protein